MVQHIYIEYAYGFMRPEMSSANPYSNLILRKEFYEHELLAEMPRLLSSLDRCPLSVSRGSFDREYLGMGYQGLQQH